MSLTPSFTFQGTGNWSLDATSGAATGGGTIQADVPTGSHIEKAFLYNTTFGSTAGSVDLSSGSQSETVSNFTSLGSDVSSGLDLTAYRADVTDFVSSVVGSGSSAEFNFTVSNIVNSPDSDGYELAIVYSNPSETERTIALLDGATNSAGDTFSINFAKPVDTTQSGFSAQMSLGIGFSFQPSNQFSIITVNGRQLSTSAGGQDDGVGQDGGLITVGGIGDSTDNPDPNVLPTSSDPDDELYDLAKGNNVDSSPFIKNGDASIAVTTRNPSGDDNIFFAGINVTANASVTSTTVVGPGQTLTVSAGQTLSNVLVESGGTLDVASGGTVEAVVIDGGGRENVFAGGIDSGTTISSGGFEDVSGRAAGTVILSGGSQTVESGGNVISAAIAGGGVETVLSGGVDSGATISSGGFEDVFGSAGGTVILNGGSQTVEAGGVVTGAVLDGIGLQLVFGFAGGTVVSSGDEQLVESGGVASGTTVSSGGLEVVLSGGVDSSATISSGGFENVFGGAGGTLILNGGSQTVEAGGSASGATISSGGLEVVLSGGVTSDTTIAGGTLELAAGAAAQGATTFSGSGGTLRIDGATTPTNTISSFAPGDTIDLAAIAFDSAGSATLLAGNVLQVSESGKTFTLNLDPGENFTGDDFMLGADAGSGTQVTASQTATVPGAGSRLAFFTPAVSDASLINVVLTSDGTDIAGKAIVGDYNIEVFTSTPGALASGFQASAFVQGAQLLTNNAIQAASPTSTEQLLDVSDPTQSYSLIDLSSSAKQGETIQIIGSTGAIYSVFGSAADTITGSANASVSQLIDASGVNKEANPGPFLGPETVTGGAGSTTVWGGKGDVITGGAGFMQVTDSSATGGQTVTGGAGALSIFDIGKNFSVTGSTAGTNFFDDTYSVSGAAVGGGSSVVGGSGTTLLAGGENTVIVAASGDAVTVGSALTYVDAQKGSTTITGGSGSGSGTVEGASGYNTNILAGSGDVITLNAAAAYIDATAGSTTITGGAGKVHVEAGAGDSITGGSGLLEVNNIGNADTIKGGTGNLFSFGKGTGETITGATSGWTLIDSSGKSSITGGSGTTAGTVTGAGGIFDNTVINGAAGDTITGGAASTTYINANLGSQTVTGGSGAATVLAGKGDSVTGGAGTLEVDLNSDQATTTVDLSKGTGAATLRDVSVSSGTAAVSVTGFSTAADTIASQTSVDTSGTFIGSSKSDGAGGTILLFRDGTQMTLAGVSDITKVKFTPSVIPISGG